MVQSRQDVSPLLGLCSTFGTPASETSGTKRCRITMKDSSATLGKGALMSATCGEVRELNAIYFRLGMQGVCKYCKLYLSIVWLSL